MKHRISAKARCDIYKHEDTQVIYCQGHSCKITIHVAFSDGTAAKRYKEYYCQHRFAECPIYKRMQEDDARVRMIVGDKSDGKH